MQCLEARIASFEAVTRPKRSAKVGFPLSAAEYPHLTPSSIAGAGFYHYPGRESETDSHDTCRCFFCGLILGGWDQDDDPFAEHVKREGDCAWKELVCRLQVDKVEGGPGRLRTIFPDAETLPNSAKMTAYREQTFGDWWPHKHPSIKELASAGFVSTPSQAAADATTCPLCQYEVEEWEETDDPIEIHHRKQPECPFFTGTVEKRKTTSKARASKAPARRGRSTVSATRDTEPDVEPVAESMELPQVEPEEDAPAPRRRGRPPKASTAASVASDSAPSATTATRGGKTTRGGRRKTAATKVKEEENALQEPISQPAVEEVPEPVEEVVKEEDEPKRQTKPLPRKRATRKTTTTDDAEPQAESTEKPAPKPRGRPKKTTLVSAPAPPPPTAPIQDPSRSEPSRPLPLSPTNMNSNVPPSQIPVMSPKSPSVRDAIASMMGVAMGSPRRAEDKVSTPAAPTLSAAERGMTLEEYVRQQYKLREGELRAEGEAAVQKFEARAREARSAIERGS